MTDLDGVNRKSRAAEQVDGAMVAASSLDSGFDDEGVLAAPRS